jgi:hypothetical protein
MKVSIISLGQCCDLIENSEICMQDRTPASTTYYLIAQGQNAVLIHTAFENYIITQGN